MSVRKLYVLVDQINSVSIGLKTDKTYQYSRSGNHGKKRWLRIYGEQ
ncbi:hypothetical Protein YC6258_00587 [Gynuella sunshinyii YC6258]|uniref:Uncharacterized protein n=1 Tax=Gynuella sunshinyii YC6258 TaxID=1445510 RepID=A0A0C5VDN1_9GAMM|nr:hypothetical Protein YC6258_00587 [Gynuella sunshinyii YC6258]